MLKFSTIQANGTNRYFEKKSNSLISAHKYVLPTAASSGQTYHHLTVSLSPPRRYGKIPRRPRPREGLPEPRHPPTHQPGSPQRAPPLTSHCPARPPRLEAAAAGHLPASSTASHRWRSGRPLATAESTHPPTRHPAGWSARARTAATAASAAASASSTAPAAALARRPIVGGVATAALVVVRADQRPETDGDRAHG